MHRARQMIGPRLALEHQGPHTAKAEQIGERGADGPAPDDHHIEVHGRGSILHVAMSSPAWRARKAGARRVRHADNELVRRLAIAYALCGKPPVGNCAT
jgi:hypothetical protein